PIAIDGSQEMIDRGRHREAVFWLVVTYSRSLAMLDHAGGAPAIEPYLASYHRLLRDLGVDGWDALDAGRQTALSLVPRVWAVAQDIIDRNPAIHP
nr:hypothetical protein [Chloroflexia bacterium]